MKQNTPYPQLFVRWRMLDPEDLLLLGAVVLLPWLFAGVPVYGFRSAALLIVLAATVATLRNGSALIPKKGERAWLVPAILLGLIATIQIVPLPPALVAIASPKADSIYRDVFPGYGTAERPNVVEALEERAMGNIEIAIEDEPAPRRDLDLFVEAGPAGRWHGWRPISLMPHSTLEALMWYVALFFAFTLTLNRTRDSDTYGQYRAMIFTGYIILAGIGLVHAATASQGTLLWFFQPWFLKNAKPFGPYVNPNNFSAAMELIIPWLAGYTLTRAQRFRWNIFADLKTPVFAAGILLCFTAAVVAGSKISAPLIALMLGILGVLAAPAGRRLLALAGIVIASVAGSFLLARTFLAERIRHALEMTGGNWQEIDRVVAWKSSIPMIEDFWRLGCGFGATPDVFAHYLPRGEQVRWEELHNDYLEVTAEGGILAALCVTALAFFLWKRLFTPGALRKRNRIDLEQLGLMMGLAALSFHALVDFNHQIPSTALLFVVVSALAWVGATKRAQRHREQRA